MQMPHSGRAWTDEETEQLARLYFAARAAIDAWTPAFRGQRAPLLQIDRIAAALGRSTGGVSGQISRMGMANPGAQLRTCLPCKGRGIEKKFFSVGVGNRVCAGCPQRFHEVRVMTRRNLNSKTWKLVVGTARAIAGKSWRRHLRRWIGENHPSPLRRIFDRVGGIEWQSRTAGSMRRMLDESVRDLDAECVRRRAELLVAYRPIELYEAEIDFVRDRGIRARRGIDTTPDDVSAAFLSSVIVEERVR